MDGDLTLELISEDESWQVFDAAAHRLLNISGKTFAERWDAGAYKSADEIEVMQVAMLRPGGRG